MTTIATDGKSMAGDGLACVEGVATTFDRKKVHVLPDGSLFGCAGESSHIAAFSDWLREGGNPPKVKDFAALRLYPDGTLHYYGDNDLTRPSNMSLPAAIGSGYSLAIGAMEAGASPERAVEIAAKRDLGTGGKVTVVHLTALYVAPAARVAVDAADKVWAA